ncbi:MAG TPA: WbqC family protein [Saprospiraceae bacterium]|nr:WbqC family protein [Saprospiraceae bacterium]HMT70849.1 WbqC family protein [Saprospiraceae bacterium]
MSIKTIAIHQPNFFPWLGYFYKMSKADVFVFHDNVQITKSGPTRRVKIKANNPNDDFQWLTVPLTKHSDFSLIKDLEISFEKNWIQKHLALIREAYRHYDNFQQFYPVLSAWYDEFHSFTSLSKLNIWLIKTIADYLEIKCVFYESSVLPVGGVSSAYNVNIVQHLGGSRYLSGKGGDNYQDHQQFTERDIELMVLDARNAIEMKLPEYKNAIGFSSIELFMSLDIETLRRVIHT